MYTIRCHHHAHFQGLSHECALPFQHEGEHLYKPTPIGFDFDSFLPDDQLAALVKELNEYETEPQYSREQIKRAAWGVFGAYIDELCENLVDAVLLAASNGIPLSLRIWSNRFERLVGEPELPPALAAKPCSRCGQTFGDEWKNAVMDERHADESWIHPRCLANNPVFESAPQET